MSGKSRASDTSISGRGDFLYEQASGVVKVGSSRFYNLTAYLGCEAYMKSMGSVLNYVGHAASEDAAASGDFALTAAWLGRRRVHLQHLKYL